MRFNRTTIAAFMLSLVSLGLVGHTPARAAEAVAPATSTSYASPLAPDPALEARVMAVAQELRCLVCQNETIAASQADLAQDLRKQIRQKLQQGQSQQEILDYMVARYGDFVRYRPALQSKTLLLWVGPFLFLLIAGVGSIWVIRQRRTSPGAPLSDEARARARALLASVNRDAPSSSHPPSTPSP